MKIHHLPCSFLFPKQFLAHNNSDSSSPELHYSVVAELTEIFPDGKGSLPDLAESSHWPFNQCADEKASQLLRFVAS